MSKNIFSISPDPDCESYNRGSSAVDTESRRYVDLWLAVLERAILDMDILVREMGHNPEIYEDDAVFRTDLRNLRKWFKSSSMDIGAYSFICSLVNIDPKNSVLKLRTRWAGIMAKSARDAELNGRARNVSMSRHCRASDPVWWKRIRRLFAENGLTFAGVSRENGLSLHAVNNCARYVNRNTERIVANALGITVQDAFPTRYFPDGSPIPNLRGKNQFTNRG